jgi:hypothetical protein
VRPPLVLAVGVVGATRFAADEAFQPFGDDVEDRTTAVSHGDAEPPPVRAADVDGCLEGADDFEDCRDADAHLVSITGRHRRTTLCRFSRC